MSRGKFQFNVKTSMVRCTCKDKLPEVLYTKMALEDQYTETGVMLVDPSSGASMVHGPFLLPIVVDGFIRHNTDSSTYTMNSALIGNIRADPACPFNVSTELMRGNKEIYMSYDFMPHKNSALAATLKISCGKENDKSFSVFGQQFTRLMYIVLSRWDNYTVEQRLEFVGRGLGTSIWDPLLSSKLKKLDEDDRSTCMKVMHDLVEPAVIQNLVQMSARQVALLPFIANGMIAIARNNQVFDRLTVQELTEMEIARRFMNNEMSIFPETPALEKTIQHMREFPHIAYLLFMHMTTNIFNGMHSRPDRPVDVFLVKTCPKSPFYELSARGALNIHIKHREIAEYARSLMSTEEKVSELPIVLENPNIMLLNVEWHDKELAERMHRVVDCFGRPDMSKKNRSAYRKCIVDLYLDREPRLADWNYVDVVTWFMFQILYETRLVCMRTNVYELRHKEAIARLTELHTKMSCVEMDKLFAEKTEKKPKEKKKKKKNQPIAEEPEPEPEPADMNIAEYDMLVDSPVTQEKTVLEESYKSDSYESYASDGDMDSEAPSDYHAAPAEQPDRESEDEHIDAESVDSGPSSENESEKSDPVEDENIGVGSVDADPAEESLACMATAIAETILDDRQLRVFGCGALYPFVPGACAYKAVGLFKHQEFIWT